MAAHRIARSRLVVARCSSIFIWSSRISNMELPPLLARQLVGLVLQNRAVIRSLVSILHVTSHPETQRQPVARTRQPSADESHRTQQYDREAQKRSRFRHGRRLDIEAKGVIGDRGRAPRHRNLRHVVDACAQRDIGQADGIRRNRDKHVRPASSAEVRGPLM